jgi:hypothetical protein
VTVSEAIPGDAGSALPKLKEHRQLVVGLSLAGGVLGLVPIPLVSQLGGGLVRTFLVRALARRRQIYISRQAALVVAEGQELSLSRLAGLAAMVWGLRLAWRRFSRALLLLFRFEEMSRTFLVGTYFDYFCLSRLGPGQSIDLAQAQRLHRAIRTASASAHLHVVTALFHKVVSDLVRAGTYIPKTLWTMALSVIRDSESDEAERVVEEDIQGFFNRVTDLVERELAATRLVALRALCAALDAAYDAPPLDRPAPDSGSNPPPKPERPQRSTTSTPEQECPDEPEHT